MSAIPLHVYGVNGLVPRRRWDYQISIYAENEAALENIHVAIRDALDGNHSGTDARWTGGGYLGRDDETGVEHFFMQFRVVESL